ncbi:MAG: BTAD domain-containing putative transcriptional regulator [Chloroflexi bacterium]|nr:BTAD domain-containing putative transcriptional regulator [Chloroflexota bacterium]
MSRLTLLLLGSPRIERDGVPIKVDTRKAIALLAYLVVTRQSHGRESLAALFWPDTAESRARLRRTLSVLNTALARSWLDIERETIRLQPERDANLWVDVEQFHQLLASCKTHGHPAEQVCPACLAPLSEAIALYRDDFMAGFTLRDSPAFDDWQLFETQALRREYLAALQLLAQGHLALGAHEQATAVLRRWLAADPLDETAHRILIMAYALAGQRPSALRHYHECTHLLAQELAIPPSPETTALYEQIRDGVWVGEASVQAWLAPVVETAARPHPPLPTPPTPFIGRQTELAEIATLLANPACRLLTLVGTGGMGKTRLALQAATAAQAQFADGVYFVPLEGVTTADQLPTAILTSLGLVLHGQGETAVRLLESLRGRALLLVLDNMEQLAAEAEWLATLLTHASHVKLLVTSRERLNLQGEWLLPVPPLSYPTTADLDQEETMAFSGVQLFEQRARALLPTFAPTPADRRAIAHICHVVQGLPLAIELAAGWVNLLSCTAIAAKIGQDLDFLATPARDAPARQRSMRRLLAEAWAQLPSAEQAILPQLAVFQGGFAVEAAEQVAQASLPLLLRLVEQSLVQRQGDGRWGMHPLLQQYAAEQLAAQGQAALKAVRHAHAGYYAAELQAIAPHCYRPEPTAWLAAELPNIRQAWQWGVAEGDAAVLSPMIAPLYHFFEERGWYGELAKLLEEALATCTEPALLAKLNGRRGAIGYRLGQLAEGWARLQAALPTLQAIPAPEEVAFALNGLGKIAQNQGQYELAAQYHQQALQQYMVLEQSWGIAQTWHNLGLTADNLGQHTQARQYYYESLALGREIAYTAGIALTLNNLGVLAYGLGEWGQAAEHYHEGLALAQEVGNPYIAGLALNNLGLLARQRGAAAEAKQHYHAALKSFGAIGHRVGVAGAHINLGRMASREGDVAIARAHFGAAEQIFRAVGDGHGVALCLWNGAELAEGQGDWSAARELYGQCLVLWRGMGDALNTAETLTCLGRVALAAGERTAAWNYLHEGLQAGLAAASWPMVCQTLVGVICFWAQVGELAQVQAWAEWLGGQTVLPAGELARLEGMVGRPLPPAGEPQGWAERVAGLK